MVSRNLLDPGGPELDPEPHDADIAETRDPRWWCVAALVSEVGLSRSRLHAILQQVPPEHVDGRTRYWRMATVHRILVDAELRRTGAIASGDAIDPNHARARKDLALAEETELRVRERRGAMLPVEVAAEAGGALLAAVRSQLEVLGATLAPQLAEQASAREIQSTIDAEAERILRGLADGLAELGEHPPTA